MLFRSAPSLLDSSWANLSMALIGDILDPDDEVCGIVVSTRPKVDRIQLWTRGRDDVDRINAIGRRIVESLMLEGRDVETISMEFQVMTLKSESTTRPQQADVMIQFNASNSNPPPNKYLHIPFPPPRASFSHLPPNPSRLGHGISGLNISPNPIPRPDRLGVEGNWSMPPSPTTPTPMGNAEMLPPPPPLRRMASGQGSNAFTTGPMGGGGGERGSMSGQSGIRRDATQAVPTCAGIGR